MLIDCLTSAKNHLGANAGDQPTQTFNKNYQLSVGGKAWRRVFRAQGGGDGTLVSPRQDMSTS
jgi:cell wall assembly regulator SMI1